MFVWQGREILAECIPSKMGDTFPGLGYIVRIEIARPHFSFIFLETGENGIELNGSSGEMPNRFLKMGDSILSALTEYRHRDAATYAEIERMAKGPFNYRLVTMPGQEREKRSQMAELEIVQKLKAALGNNIWYDSKKSCYTIKQDIPGSATVHYDFYPKGDRLLIRHQNRWLSNAAKWLLNTFDEQTKQNKESNNWRSSHNQ